MHFYEDPKLEQLEGQLLRQLLSERWRQFIAY